MGGSKDSFWESVNVKDVLDFENVPPCLTLTCGSFSVIHATVHNPTNI